MKKTKIVCSILLFILLIGSVSNIFATGTLVNDIFGGGGNFLNPQTDANNTVNTDPIKLFGTNLVEYINENIIGLILKIGNLAIAIATVVLGAKYIWSGIDGKTQIKETLPSYVIGVVMFYGAQLIYDFIYKILKDQLFGSGATIDSISSSIAGTVFSVINIVCIAGIVFVGLKYMWSSPGAKADIKNKLIPVVVGIILVYSMSQVVSFIVKITTETIPNTNVVVPPPKIDQTIDQIN